MATATYKYARDTMAIALASSSDDWDNGANIYASDNSDAAPGGALTSGQFTNYLGAKDFGFSLPNDAIVTGIQVRTEKEGTHVDDKHLFLTLDGATLVGTDHAALTTAWPDTDTKVIQGGIADEWGLRLTGADVNKCTFGYAIACVADATGDTPGVDGMEIQLTYTDPADSTETSSDLKKGRDIHRLLDKFMSDKHTTKQFTILRRNGIYEITEWSF
jgi:hypothetical protein